MMQKMPKKLTQNKPKSQNQTLNQRNPKAKKKKPKTKPNSNTKLQPVNFYMPLVLENAAFGLFARQNKSCLTYVWKESKWESVRLIDLSESGERLEGACMCVLVSLVLFWLLCFCFCCIVLLLQENQHTYTFLTALNGKSSAI